MQKPLLNPTEEVIAKELAEMVIDGDLSYTGIDFIRFDKEGVEYTLQAEQLIHARVKHMVYELQTILSNKDTIWVQVLDQARRH